MEKKVYQLGTWHDDTILDNVINEMAKQVRAGKGTKVKLTVTKHGVTVIKSAALTGKQMTDYLPIENVHFITVNKYHPSCLLVIGKDHPTKYQILAFRCANGLDAGMFVKHFKDIKRQSNPGEGYNVETKKSHEGENWTLRSKNQNNNNRQLSAVVDMHTERSKVNGDIHIHMNGGSHQENGVARTYINPIADENPPSVKTEEITHAHTTTSDKVVVHEKHVVHHRHLSDNVSEASETSLRDELDVLSQELREIKFMLEKSTGITPEEYQKSVVVTPRRQEHTTSEEVIVTRTIEKPDTDVVVRREETTLHSQRNGEVRHQIITNGKIERAASPKMEGEVRVTVPDYRSSTDSTTRIYSTAETPRVQPDEGDNVNYKSWGGDRRSVVRPQSNWRDEVVLRQSVHGRTRPRSARYSSSSYASVSGSVRSSRAPSAYVLTEHTRHPGGHHTLPANRGGSYKRLHVATTVHKPIEKVYGRHSTYGGKPILMERPSVVDYNQNNFEKSHHHNLHDSVIIRT
ncbi:uncharacterized protein LOC132560596 [Ylistrum balloti]|uniref:uncharacterized protein LOC132560596 n=1 Tax=Ylistrum balloti TaxID=509963 RepID=UPI002905CBE1|nr:uncharacterized protein LOC132560596 [Ylistrum balloti]